MSDEKPDLTQTRPLTDEARSKLAELLPEGRILTNIVCVNRPGTGELWYYDTDEDEWIAPCVC